MGLLLWVFGAVEGEVRTRRGARSSMMLTRLVEGVLWLPRARQRPLEGGLLVVWGPVVSELEEVFIEA